MRYVSPRGLSTPASSATLRSILARLLEDTSAMVADFSSEVRKIPSYGQKLVSHEAIESSAQLSLSVVIKAIITATETGIIDLGSLPSRIASSRANMRVSSEDLMEAIRLDFAVLWRHILASAQGTEAAAITAEVELVWQVIEQYAQETRDSYREYTFAVSPDIRASRQHHIGRLFGIDSSVDAEQIAERVGVALKLEHEQDFVLCVIRSDGFDALRNIELMLENLNARFFVWDRSTDVVFFWPARNLLQDPLERERILSPLAHLPYALVEHVHGLAGVKDAAAAGRRVLTHLKPGMVGPRTLLDVWPHAAASTLVSLSIEFDAIVDRLIELPEAEAKRIIEATSTYFDSGSASAAGRALFTHRNTILNRLRRFFEVTGLDPNKPRDAALAILIIERIDERLEI